MLKLFKTILKTGRATHAYPFKEYPVYDDFRGRPIHNPEQCIACSACAVACPSNALSMETDLEKGSRTWKINYGRCIFCARCEEICPTRAISLSKEFELAVADKNDLMHSATFSLAACESCGRFFAPLKEVEYAFELIRHSGLKKEIAEARRQILYTCTDCKRRKSLPPSLIPRSPDLKKENRK